MNKGVIYITTTAVSGLIKIGKTETKNFGERMRNLEFNGYYNVSGLKRFFAIEVEDYHEKERLLHEIFSKHQVGASELFSLDETLVQQLLLAFAGHVVYPENVNQEKSFDEVSHARIQGQQFSFQAKGIQNGSLISFWKDPTITAVVCGEREVEFEDQVWRLSPLTRKIYELRSEQNKSGAYQGSQYWLYGGEKLSSLPDVQ